VTTDAHVAASAQRVRWYATPRAILAAGWLVFLLYAYPGFMPTSSVDELIDSRYGAFTDWHSPVMTEVWRIVGVVASGPAGMLLLQSGLFLFGAFALLRRAMAPRNAAIASACLLVFPPVMATMAVISQDSQLAGFLVGAAAMFASERRGIRIVGLALVMLACGMRDGAALAALPIVVLGFTWRDGQRWFVRYGIAAVAWLGLAAIAGGLATLLVDSETKRPQENLAMLDVVGVIALSDPMTDADIRSQLPGVRLAVDGDLQRRARSLHGKPEQFLKGAARLFEPPTSPDETDAIIDARSRLRRAHPRAYLAERWYQFVRILGFKQSKSWSAVYDTFLSPALREPALHAAHRSPVQKFLHWPVKMLGGTSLFVPYVYFFIAIVLLPLAIRRRQRDAWVLLASGLASELALFTVTSEIEFRSSFWMIASTTIAIMLMVARGIRLRERTSTPDNESRSTRQPA
jgi:hypothetical protein